MNDHELTGFGVVTDRPFSQRQCHSELAGDASECFTLESYRRENFPASVGSRRALVRGEADEVGLRCGGLEAGPLLGPEREETGSFDGGCRGDRRRRLAGATRKPVSSEDYQPRGPGPHRGH